LAPANLPVPHSQSEIHLDNHPGVGHHPEQYDREEREEPFIPPPVEEPPPVEGDGAGIVDTRPVEEQLAEARKKVREVSMHNGP
jgi:hypothetical protein